MEELQNPISRRRMLKRVGAGAAIAWSAPILSSLRTPAFAQAYPPRCEEPCADIFCSGDATNCGESGPFANCLCSQDVEGNCVCSEDAACTGTNDCNSSTECPSGQRCVKVCCSGLNQCLAPCGTNPTATTITGRAASQA